MLKSLGKNDERNQNIFSVYSDDDDRSKYKKYYPVEEYFAADQQGMSDMEAFLVVTKQIPGKNPRAMRRVITFELKEVDPTGRVVQKYLSKIILYVSKYPF